MHFHVKNDEEIEFTNLISDFIIPFDIKNDIIYCQKSFRTYLKVHQIVVTRYGPHVSTTPKMSKIFSDLEREIYEINAEQKFLLIRLRRFLDEFYKNQSLNNNRFPIDQEYGRKYLHTIFENSCEMLLINECEPFNVKKRHSFAYWNSKINAIADKCTIENNTETKTEQKPLEDLMKPIKIPIASQPPSREIQSNGTAITPIGTNATTELSLKQVSLLKPRLDRSQEENHVPEQQISKADPKLAKEAPKVAISINNGRMNLLQALNKAKNQNQILATAAAAAANNPSVQKNCFPTKKIEVPLVIAAAEIKKNNEKQKLNQQFKEIQQRQNLNARLQSTKPSTSKIIKQNDNVSPPLNSSDDSQDGVTYLSSLNKEINEPTEYSQEMFLSLFGLNTISHSISLKQRRSKRRRRNVQSNERKDFHYGALELSEHLNLQKDKKKKIFLASPTATRSLKRKQNEKINSNKRIREVERSSSSSPEQKIVCNQCSKNGDAGLSICEKCREYFHAKCHQGAFLRKPLQIRMKICPTCYKKDKSQPSSSDEKYPTDKNETIKIVPNAQKQVNKHSKITQPSIPPPSIVNEVEKCVKNKSIECVKEVEQIRNEMKEDKNLLCEEILNKFKCQEVLPDDCNSSTKSSKASLENLKNFEEQNRFDEIMMLIHDAEVTRNEDEIKSDHNVYEIYDSDNTIDSDDVVMVINQDSENVYEIKENSLDQTYSAEEDK